MPEKIFINTEDDLKNFKDKVSNEELVPVEGMYREISFEEGLKTGISGLPGKPIYLKNYENPSDKKKYLVVSGDLSFFKKLG